jgi:lipopolysaccharide export system permease protein
MPLRSIYQFGGDYRTDDQARQGKHIRDNLWRLEDVVQTRFEDGHVSVSRLAEKEWRSVLTPGILSVLLVAPERMSLWTLFSYVQHLRENRQESGRYEIALWNKIVYPFAILVMMILALPFAYMNVREGRCGTKIFAGIIWDRVHLVNVCSAISDNSRPPLLAAVAPTAASLALAIWMIRRLKSGSAGCRRDD